MHNRELLRQVLCTSADHALSETGNVATASMLSPSAARNSFQRVTQQVEALIDPQKVPFKGH